MVSALTPILVKEIIKNSRQCVETVNRNSAVPGKNLVNSILDETEKIKTNYRLLIFLQMKKNYYEKTNRCIHGEK